jgi:hypothetical protein
MVISKLVLKVHYGDRFNMKVGCEYVGGGGGYLVVHTESIDSDEL